MISRCNGKGSAFLVFSLLILISALIQPLNAWAQVTGEQIFQSNCSACHSIGGGRRVGPDLMGVNERRSQEWLEQFIKSPQSVINSGDAEAVALLEEYSGMLMPEFPLSDEQISQVLNYIQATSSNLAADSNESAVEEPEPAVQVSMEDVVKGQDLFQGTTRFQNGGPTCNACHDVKNDAVIGGGILAKELTTVFSRMGSKGVEAILGQAPFPVMQAAYKDNTLTDDEITYLVAFLQDADAQHLFQQPRDYGVGLFASGAVGAGVIYLLFAFIWRGRKRGSVNSKIFDRQIKSD
jgi:mono/diheme cytochrome c family protein